MAGILAVAGENLISPIVLCFVLGLVAALARSDLSFPEAIAKGMSLYLLFSIGFKGGTGVAAHGADLRMASALVVGILLSFLLPLVAFALLRSLARVSPVDAAAIAGHYGSISIVTFLAANSLIVERGIPFEGYMVAVAAAMEAPAIMSALWLAAKWRDSGERDSRKIFQDVLLNGSIVLLVGAFGIGWITGKDGLAQIDSFIVAPFKGVLCLFLLDMGLVAGRGLLGTRGVLSARLVAFGVLMPLVGSVLGLAAGVALSLSLGGAVLFAVLCASASYIAVPAAMRVALPQANPALSLTLSLGITFPFNLILGIPLYLAVAGLIVRT